jgi:hypothetical protein
VLTTPAYAEMGPTRTRPLVRYLENLRRLAAEDVGTLHTGHGDNVLDHRAAVASRLDAAEKRCTRVVAALGRGPLTAFEIARALWPAERVEWDPVLAVSDVVGHLELLADRTEVAEEGTAGEVTRWRLTSV